MAKHAVLGPSGAERWMVCSGSVALSHGADNPSNNAADEGTCYHFLASVCLEGGLDAADFVGQEITVVDTVNGDHTCFVRDAPAGCEYRYRTTVDADNAAHLQVYLDYVRTAAMTGVLHVEQSVPIDHLTDEEDAEGTADAIIINPDQKEIHVIDLKFGRGVEVHAVDNHQMRMYALGAIEKHPGVYTNVRVTIVQPRSGDGKPKEWALPIGELHEFGVKVKRAASSVWAAVALHNELIEAGIDPSSDTYQAWADQYLLVGDKQCKFCRAKPRCPRIAVTIEGMTGVDFDDPGQDTLPVVIEEVPGEHPNEDLARKMAKCDLIEGWIKGVRAEVERELIDGNEVPGYKLVQGKRGSRKWVSDATAVELLKKMRLKIEEMYDMSVKSPTNIEKLLKKAAPKKWERVQPLITQSEGGLSVAPLDDPRDAVNIKPTAEGMAAEVDEPGVESYV